MRSKQLISVARTLPWAAAVVGFLFGGAVVTPSFGAGGLQGENAREIDRVTAATIDRANALRAFSTPDAIRRGFLFAALGVPSTAGSQLVLWHEISLDVTAIDHTPLLTASPETYHEQYGPHRTSRALALVHLAMFEAANGASSAAHKYKSYLNIPIQPGNVSQAAAIIEAAFETLTWLYPGLAAQPLSQGFSLRAYHQDSIRALTDSPAAIEAGQNFGRRIAAAIFELRRNDGSEVIEGTWGWILFHLMHRKMGSIRRRNGRWIQSRNWRRPSAHIGVTSNRLS